MGIKKFTNDPVEILLSKLGWMYTLYKGEGEVFKGKDEYEVVKEILSVVERNNPSVRKITKATMLHLIKNREIE